MRNPLMIGGYFIITFILIVLSSVYLSILEYNKNQGSLFSESKVAFAALPTTQNLLRDRIQSKDARFEVLSNFLQKYDSALAPFTQNIITAADKYGLDFRLLPAIAMQESNLCKKIIKESHNCWGYEIYGNKAKKFKDYPTAIDAVSQTLASDYKENGLVTPEEIMKKYTPGSNGSWARGVEHFMTILSLE